VIDGAKGSSRRRELILWDPTENVHDFKDKELGKVVPHGVCGDRSYLARQFGRTSVPTACWDQDNLVAMRPNLTGRRKRGR